MTTNTMQPPSTSTDKTKARAAEAGLDRETLDLMLESLRDFVDAALPLERRLELDRADECPEHVVRAMCGDEMGVQLVFIPQAYGGMGGGAFDSYRVCECLARIDIGIATSVFVRT